jgi:protein SCO1/2
MNAGDDRAAARGAMTKYLRNPYLWGLIIGCVLVTMIRPLLRREPPPPPVLHQVPAFELVDANGQPFGSDELRGHVYVANFFFTRCPSICPPLMQGVARLQQRYHEAGLDDIRLISISADPAYDTPEQLRAVQSGYGADPERWRLLTGTPDAIRALAVQGFRVAHGEKVDTGDGGFDIAHTGKLMLVDPDGGLRGYYDSDSEGFDEVFWRSRHVLAEAQEKERQKDTGEN